jgi:hypothetical protein
LKPFKEFIRNFCLHVKYCYFFNFNVAKLVPYYNILKMHNNKKYGRKTFQSCGDWPSALLLTGYLVSVLCIKADLHYTTFALCNLLVQLELYCVKYQAHKLTLKLAYIVIAIVVCLVYPVHSSSIHIYIYIYIREHALYSFHGILKCYNICNIYRRYSKISLKMQNSML